MRSDKQQFFLLLAVFAGCTSCSAVKATSLDTNYRLQESERGSQVQDLAAKPVLAKPVPEKPLPEKPIFISSSTPVKKQVAEQGNPKVNHGQGIIAPPYETAQSLEIERARLDETAGNDDSEQSSAEQSPENTQEISPETAPAEETEPGNLGEREPIRDQTYEQVERREAPPLAPPIAPRRASEETTVSPESRPAAPVHEVAKKKLNNAKSKKTPPRKAANKPKETKPVIPVLKPETPTDSEESKLSHLVHELEYGTLPNSIELLKKLNRDYPEDPDYSSLLAMALRLRDGDVWYEYKRQTDNKETTETKAPPAPVQIIKITENENVNQLKKASWFLMRSARR